jgi:CheY-like chemotaxis protein
LEAEVECKACGEAVNGQDAIEKAAQLHPHLVVLDLAMPVMNGLEAARVLRKTMPDVPLIMLTNHASKLIEPEARAAGISAVLSKESDMRKLAEWCLDLGH